MNIKLNENLIQFLKLYEPDDKVVDDCILSTKEILNTIFPLDEPIHEIEGEENFIANCSLVSCYMARKLKVNSFYSVTSLTKKYLILFSQISFFYYYEILLSVHH